MSRGHSQTEPLKEREIQKLILDYLQARGIFAWRNNTGAFAGEHNGKKRFVRFGFPGVADILGIIRTEAEVGSGIHRNTFGRFLSIEVKRPGGKQTDDQKAFQEAVERNGGIYILASSLEDVMEVLGNERR